MRYETQRLVMRTIEPDEAHLYQRYLLDNKVFLSEWEPERKNSYYDEENIKRMIHSGTLSP
jgi:RimJ/RimL family protein N-acetyltransferase